MSIRITDARPRGFTASDYIMAPALLQAVELAIALEQPLLLTGEPGTGKTRLADKIASDLAAAAGHNFTPEPLVFNTKTDAQARDLSYYYDAVAHFQSANVQRGTGQTAPVTGDFIQLRALGRAIALTRPDQPGLQGFLDPATPAAGSVVLIDEIDKAPRDLPNDILHEIDRYQFSIKELDRTIQRGPDHRIITIMTSNSEKNLPDAFLRRCVFYHIPFPDEDLLFRIAKTQIGTATAFTDESLRGLIGHFTRVRAASVRKPPATAELLAWLRLLGLGGIAATGTEPDTARLRDYLSVLVKTKEDHEAVRGLYS